MRKTSNYNLSLYDKEDKMIITAEEDSLNANMQIIDATLKEKATIQDMTDYIEENKEILKGEDGRGISKIEKTATNGLVDTYTITYTDETTSTYTVTNGEDGDNAEINLDDYQEKDELQQVELLITYEDNTTETVKLVTYK